MDSTLLGMKYLSVFSIYGVDNRYNTNKNNYEPKHCRKTQILNVREIDRNTSRLQKMYYPFIKTFYQFLNDKIPLFLARIIHSD